MTGPAPAVARSLAAIAWRWRVLLVAALAVTAVLAVLDPAAAGDPWGDTIVDQLETTDPGEALGAPDASAALVGASTGVLTIAFADNAVLDGAGNDLVLHLTGTGDAEADVLVSADGVNFIWIGQTDDGGDAAFDLADAGLAFAAAVRIANVTDGGAFDLDALTALHGLDLHDASLSLDPASAENPGFTSHTVTAELLELATSVASVPVAFEITAGPNAGLTGAATTDGDGQAEFSWVGTGGPGTDEVAAWIDLDLEGDRDPSEPQASATKTWHGVTGTITMLDVDGGGLVDGDLVQVLVADRDLDTSDGQDTVSVAVISDSDPVGIAFELTETGDHTGEFVGFFEVGDTSDDAAPTLQAAEGDTITAAYDDALDGEGYDPEPVTASLEVVGAEVEGLRVTLCHRPPGNPGNQQTLTLGGEAYRAHLAHGDVAGECGDPVAPTKQEQAEERRTEQQAERAQARTARDAAFCERQGDDHPRCSAEDGE